MQPSALRALEFDRIVEAVTDFALTPMGAERLSRLTPSTDPQQVAAVAGGDDRDGAVRHGARRCSRCARRASCRRSSPRWPSKGARSKSLRLLALATFLDSIDESRAGIRRAPGSFPLLDAAATGAASFKGESAQVARQDRSVGRGRRSREPRAAARFAIGSASRSPGCAARSSRTCAARRRRSTCRTRSSPNGTAATSCS